MGLYASPNKIVSKSERSNWRHKVKKYYKDLNNFKPDTEDGIKATDLDIKLFQVAEETIRANATVEDTEKTEENKETIAATVSPVYTYNSDLKDLQTSKIEILFATIDEIKQDADKKYQDDLKEARKKASENNSSITSQELAEIKVNKLTNEE